MPVESSLGRNLIAVMLNTGNSTNLKKMAEGYKLKSDDIMAWVHQHATKKRMGLCPAYLGRFQRIKISLIRCIVRSLVLLRRTLRFAH